MTLLVSFLQPRPALRGTDRPAFTSRKSAVLGAFQGLAVDNWEACQIRIRRLLIGGSPPLGTLCANREAYGIDALYLNLGYNIIHSQSPLHTYKDPFLPSLLPSQTHHHEIFDDMPTTTP
ncbi:hypothetical protein EYC84_008250 [Monilinia fructicola]|uniref:Uncharacterized protein n=1 Tax=Monilinia fructicola TaxID=38448 RepID=A0A5M9JGA6_MONFR|nr:hypothetical protein EYC84_008250 [Monilinia fructicola]